jgi:hypothetical protein
MKKIILLLLITNTSYLFSQKDSLQLGDSYLEDQLYFGVTFNQLINQSSQVAGSGFSYGINTGYIRDIPIVKSGKIALGIGIGYAFDSLKHGFKVSSQNSATIIETDSNLGATNALKLHTLEFPIEFRWRTSTANKYRFWRIYSGVKIGYNFKNRIDFISNSVTTSYSNIERFNKVQYGLTFSAGYAAFNVNLYYGLTPLFKDADVGTKSIGTKVVKLGMVFYIL